MNADIISYMEIVQLCDVTINVGGTSIPGHKCVLAAVSPYFHAMFNGKSLKNGEETTSQQPRYICQGLLLEAIASLLFSLPPKDCFHLFLLLRHYNAVDSLNCR